MRKVLIRNRGAQAQDGETDQRCDYALHDQWYEVHPYVEIQNEGMQSDEG